MSYTTEDLDAELSRRKMFPPDSISTMPGTFHEQFVTVEEMRQELNALTPLHHDGLSWMKWELALAERQALHEPGKPFYRVVRRKPN